LSSGTLVQSWPTKTAMRWLDSMVVPVMSPRSAPTSWSTSPGPSWKVRVSPAFMRGTPVPGRIALDARTVTEVLSPVTPTTEAKPPK